jgi:hypothetical protein
VKYFFTTQALDFHGCLRLAHLLMV